MLEQDKLGELETRELRVLFADEPIVALGPGVVPVN
jgi:hypothetical protein